MVGVQPQFLVNFSYISKFPCNIHTRTHVPYLHRDSEFFSFSSGKKVFFSLSDRRDPNYQVRRFRQEGAKDRVLQELMKGGKNYK